MANQHLHWSLKVFNEKTKFTINKCALQPGFILLESSQTSKDAFFTSGAMPLFPLAQHAPLLSSGTTVLKSWFPLTW